MQTNECVNNSDVRKFHQRFRVEKNNYHKTGSLFESVKQTSIYDYDKETHMLRTEKLLLQINPAFGQTNLIKTGGGGGGGDLSSPARRQLEVVVVKAPQLG